MSELEQLRQEAEQLKNQIRVSIFNFIPVLVNYVFPQLNKLGCYWIRYSVFLLFLHSQAAIVWYVPKFNQYF